MMALALVINPRPVFPYVLRKCSPDFLVVVIQLIYKETDLSTDIVPLQMTKYFIPNELVGGNWIIIFWFELFLQILFY